MILVERGQVRLRDRVTTFIPEFGVNGKKNITVSQLAHSPRRPIPDNAIKDYNDGRDQAIERINALKLTLSREHALSIRRGLCRSGRNHPSSNG